MSVWACVKYKIQACGMDQWVAVSFHPPLCFRLKYLNRANEWIVVTFGALIHGPQRRTSTYFGDCVTFNPVPP